MRHRIITVMLLLLTLSLLSACASTRPAPNGIAEFKSLAGSRWHLVCDEPRYGQREFDLIFRKAGRLSNTHPNDSTPDNDAWEMNGRNVVLKFNNAYATYRGELTDDGNGMAGTATNVIGEKWEWSARRL